MENKLSTQITNLALIGFQKGHKLNRLFSATKLFPKKFLMLLLHRGSQNKTKPIGFAKKNIIEQKLCTK